MAEKITKQEAVRRALKELGNDAKPTQMKGWIKEKLGIEMSTDHISTAKGDILRKAGVKAPKRAASKAGPKKEAPRPQAPAAVGNGKESGIPLQDILYVKQLVGRFGPEQLHTLIDAFAK